MCFHLSTDVFFRWCVHTSCWQVLSTSGFSIAFQPRVIKCCHNGLLVYAVLCNSSDASFTIKAGEMVVQQLLLPAIKARTISSGGCDITGNAHCTCYNKAMLVKHEFHQSSSSLIHSTYIYTTSLSMSADSITYPLHRHVCAPRAGGAILFSYTRSWLKRLEP